MAALEYECEAGDSLEFSINDAERKDPESGTWSPITAPDSVTLFVGRNGRNLAEVAGNQMGSSNSWNAEYRFVDPGKYIARMTIVKGTAAKSTRVWIITVRPGVPTP